MSPIFDLECQSCGWTASDVLLSTKEDVTKRKCGICHKATLRKQPCRVHARFYGDGFFKQNTKGD